MFSYFIYQKLIQEKKYYKKKLKKIYF